MYTREKLLKIAYKVKVLPHRDLLFFKANNLTLNVITANGYIVAIKEDRPVAISNVKEKKLYFFENLLNQPVEKALAAILEYDSICYLYYKFSASLVIDLYGNDLIHVSHETMERIIFDDFEFLISQNLWE